MAYLHFSELSPKTHRTEHRITEEGARYYIEKQGDPIAGHQTKRLKVADHGEYWKVESSLPISLEIPKDPEQVAIDWDQMPEREAQGHALWKISLSFLPALIEASHNFDLVEVVLDSLWEYNKSDAWMDRSAWMTSLDHMVATRIRTLCTLRSHYSLAQRETPEVLQWIYENDIESLRHNPDDYFPPNNHGAMVAIAVLHAAAIFGKYSFNDTQKIQDMRHSLDQFGWYYLERVLATMFDEFGIAAENSPEYQRYWISLLSPVRSFLKVFPEVQQPAEHRIDLRSMLEKAETALAYFTDSSSRLIPIGDTHPRKITPKVTSLKPFLVSEQSGFAIYRQESTVLTFNSGSTNYAHKHCDDLSLTLEYRGTPLLLDSGYYSHDWKDPKAIYTKSQNAHSGLFLTGLDNLHPGKLYWPGGERIKAGLSDLSSNGAFKVCGDVTIDDRATLRRTIDFRSPEYFRIQDFAIADGRVYGTVVQRFILPLNAQITADGNALSIRVKGAHMVMVFSGSSRVSGSELSIAQTEPHFRGWISPELNQLEATIALDVPISVGASARIDVFLGEAN